MYNNPYIMYQPRIQPMEPIQQPVQPIQQPIQQPVTQPIVQNNQAMLLGKHVESIDVVKATEVPFDGSISYFPLSDGSSIITKKIQNDGTSKIVIYKPVIEEEKKEPKYITEDDLQKAISSIDLSDLKTLKSDIKDFDRRLKDIENIKKR